MLDHILGRPSTRLKRAQVIFVLCFSSLSLLYGDRDGPHRLQLIRWLNRQAKSRFTPWQVVLGTVTAVYAIRNLDHLLGFGAPEPLARMYSRSFYRTTWINTALDAGFATAMPIRPHWLKDILALLFSGYYLIYANEADEKLRKYRAFCTVEMMRETWHKTTNPYIRLATWIHRPSLKIAKEVLLPRPSYGKHASRPTVAWLFFDGDERALRSQTELILDIPGGGFISMDPRHHEERLRALAKQTGRPVLALNYCKAPEFPFPYALEECFDAYRTLYETRGAVIGMGRASLSSVVDDYVGSFSDRDASSRSLEKSFRIILSGDSAGGNLATGVMLKIIEYPQPHIEAAYLESTPSSSSSGSRSNSKKSKRTPPPLPKPIAILLAYPALNFAYSSWMKPEHIRVLRQQSEVNLQEMRKQSQSAPSSSGSALRSGKLLAGSSSAAPASSAHTQQGGGTGTTGKRPPTPGHSPLNPNYSGRRPSLNSRVGRPSSLEEERRAQLRATGLQSGHSSRESSGGGSSVDAKAEAAAAAASSSSSAAAGMTRSHSRDRALGLVPPPGVPPIVTSPSAILNSFMGKAQQVIRRSTSRGRMALSSGEKKKADGGVGVDAEKAGATGDDAVSGGEGKTRPSGPKRDRSYSSLAGQAQMHLFERARFAEAEPSASDDELGGRTSSGVHGDEEEDKETRVRSEAEREYHQSVAALTASRMGISDAASTTAADNETDVEGTSSGYNTDHESRAHEEQQKALRAATDAADARMASARAKRGQRAYGTRLTMTSMAAYFQDRILTQSMMRAMAILYIGPKYQPDFEHDYYLSPIVAPSALLAEFPPCLFVCGEKDPICDDTVVMAGKIREAKAAKKRDLERKRAGPSARFGEGLRMSSAKSVPSPTRDPIEDESPEDWVQMRIIEGWSHGFLQMSALMPEAKEVIKFLGVWMWETFEDWNARNGVGSPSVAGIGAGAAGSGAAGGVHLDIVEIAEQAVDLPDTTQSSAARALRERGPASAPAAESKGSNAAAARRPSEGDDDDDEPLSFTTTKTARRTPCLGGAGSPFVGGTPVPGSPAPGGGASGRFGVSSAERSVSPMSRAPLLSAVPSSVAGPLQATDRPAASPTSAPPPPATAAIDQPSQAAISRTQMHSLNGPLSSTAAMATSAAHALPNLTKPLTVGGLDPISSTLPGPASAIPASATITAAPAPVPGTGSGHGTPDRRLSFGLNGAQAQSTDERERRGSGTANGSGPGLDAKYKAMLVQESQLLQRRRGEAVFGLSGGGDHEGSDEDHEHDGAEGEGEGEGDVERV
ncbi:hypothetical protein V8E36_006732 [Tilletia maclaganii]